MSSIRTQLILWNLAILTIILLACGSAVHYRMQAGLIASVDRELVDRARPALNMPAPPPLPQGQPGNSAPTSTTGRTNANPSADDTGNGTDNNQAGYPGASNAGRQGYPGRPPRGPGGGFGNGGPPQGSGFGNGRPPQGPGGGGFGNGGPPPQGGFGGPPRGGFGNGGPPPQGGFGNGGPPLQGGFGNGGPPPQSGMRDNNSTPSATLSSAKTTLSPLSGGEGLGERSTSEDYGSGDNGGGSTQSTDDAQSQSQFDDTQPPGPQQPPRGRPDIRILDVTGRAPSGSGPFDPAGFQSALQGTPAFNTVSQPGGQYRVYSAPHLDNGSVQTVVQAEESLAPVQTEMADLNRTLLTMIPLGLIAAAFGAAFLTIRSLRPVHQIADTVGKIQAEDLKRRLPVQGRDEFAQLSTTINGMLGRLQSAFDEQRRFTMDASHELKTPLTVIKAKTSVALTRERTPEAYQATLQTVERAADQMTSIVQDLLLLAQADSGQLGADRNPVSVRYLVESALEGVFPEGGPAITVDIPDPAPAVTVNSGQMARVFRNLIENAVRHTPPTGRVTVSVQKSTAGVETVVRDTGEGIAPEHLARLGTRFYRVDTARTRERGGTGLGLAICKGIIEAHGGHLRFESTLGRGTTVHVWLPK